MGEGTWQGRKQESEARMLDSQCDNFLDVTNPVTI
jgi:hypothetical protein